MTKEQFTSLLKNPSTINLNLIKGLEEITERFPYFQNAHLLLAKQYHGHENIRYESYLRKASVYATDRELLYQLIKSEPESVIHMSVAHEEIPSKETLAQKEKEIPSAINQETEHQMHVVSDDLDSSEELAVKIPVPFSEISETIENEKIVLDQQTSNLTVDPKEIIEQRLRELALEKNNTLVDETENVSVRVTDEETEETIKSTKQSREREQEDTTVIDLEKRNDDKKVEQEKILFPLPGLKQKENLESHSFTEWLKLKTVPIIQDDQVGEYRVEPNSAKETPPKEIKKVENQLIEKFIKTEPRIIPARSEFYSPGNMARKSAKEHEDLISETLARIYAQQGNLRKAIETYHKLALKIPEKSSYFAALIKELEEKEKI
ncbi:MAG TPA: hypothetical protein PKD91_08500 [Bacteroidia bacterium]|nr:hypothetical protein [Bacteroidia bacterium]